MKPPEPAAIVRGTQEALADLAQKANKAHGGVLRSVEQSLDYARRAGEFLNAARDLVPAGGWLKWFDQHIDYSCQTADDYRKVASRWSEIEARIQSTEGVSL